MWIVVYVTQSMETAKKLGNVLYDNKVISKLRSAEHCNTNRDGECYEVLVPDTELETAQDIIFENELF